MSLLEKSFDRTLDAWTHSYLAPVWRGAVVEGWLFEGVDARRAAEARLAQAGVTARFRSAYKPLLHYFLEEVDRDGLVSALVRYPLHEHALAKRFTLEAYPLVALLEGVRVVMQEGGSDLHYDVSLSYADGRTVESRVFAPNVLGAAQDGTPELSPTGWLR
ncbi:MAG: peptidase M14, partial [Achromobacter spanius]